MIRLIRNLGPALALFFRQAWKTFQRQPKLAEFGPFRCQHCDRQIHPGGPGRTFVDNSGSVTCTGGVSVLHRPMPVVRGGGDNAA